MNKVNCNKQSQKKKCYLSATTLGELVLYGIQQLIDSCNIVCHTERHSHINAEALFKT